MTAWIEKQLPTKVIGTMSDGKVVLGVDAPTYELVKDNGDGTWTVRVPAT